VEHLLAGKTSVWLPENRLPNTARVCPFGCNMEGQHGWMVWSHSWAMHAEKPYQLDFWGLTLPRLELLLARYLLEQKMSKASKQAVCQLRAFLEVHEGLLRGYLMDMADPFSLPLYLQLPASCLFTRPAMTKA
jgi:hypothetical protein